MKSSLKKAPKNAPAKSFFDKLKKVKETFLPINI